MLSSNSPIDLVRRNFPSWDRDSDGILTAKERWSQISDPAVKGEDAVALATLHWHLTEEGARLGLDDVSISYEELDQLKSPKNKTRVQGLFRHYQQKLKSRADTLFTMDLPGVDIMQGETPTCSFLASILTLSANSPERLKSMIESGAEGEHIVTFPGSSNQPEFVQPLTDTESAIYSRASDGDWLSVLEKAWAQKLERERFPEREISRPFEEARCSPARAIRELTGQRAKGLLLPETLPDSADANSKLLQAIGSNVAEKRPVVASCYEPTISGLMDQHAYAVSHWDLAQSIVGLQNPMGWLEPTNEAGEPRDAKDDGKFEISLDEFLANFREITLQV